MVDAFDEGRERLKQRFECDGIPCKCIVMRATKDGIDYKYTMFVVELDGRISRAFVEMSPYVSELLETMVGMCNATVMGLPEMRAAAMPDGSIEFKVRNRQSFW